MSDLRSGTVTSENEKGIKLDGGDWLNYSKYAEGLQRPERGQRAEVELDKSGFIRKCRVLDNGNGNGGSHAPSYQPSGTRERTISRLAILKAAAEFSANRTDIKSGDVLKIAAVWERWVNEEPVPVSQPVSGDHDPYEAF